MEFTSMTFNTTKIDEANASISGTISAQTIENNLNKVALQASKSMNVQGFRKGKVPVAVVKARYGEKLRQDAEGDAVREALKNGLAELQIDNKDIIGEPAVTKFDKKEDGSVEFEITMNLRPEIVLGDYKALVPAMTLPEVTDAEIEEQLNDIASQGASMEPIKKARAVKSGDFAVIDFEGFKDGVAFAGGKADKYTLEIGSNSFVPGFEDQVIGMKYGEEKEITVTFPESYGSKDLAGADVVFKVKLHEIKVKEKVEINDELAKKVLPNEENATVELLKEKIKEQILTQKKSAYFQEEIKSLYTEALVNAIDFAVPAYILEQEINQSLNNKIRAMSEEEIENLRANPDMVKAMQEEARPEALSNVKATFIIDALAKAEGVVVSDQEVTQTLYYEAMMSGQDGRAMIEQYEKAGYLPMIKMSMIESKVMSKILDEALGK
jgi:trigger factor